MVTRTSTLDFKSTGADQARGQVISLADATARLKANTAALAGPAREATAAHGALGTVTRAAAADVARFAGALGPVGVGLAEIAMRGPQAVAALVNTGSAAQRASVFHQALNVALLSTTAILTTGAVAAAAYTKEIIGKADAYASLEARVRIYTKSAMQAAEIEKQLFDQARQARVPVDTESRLFGRLAPAVADTGRGPEAAVNIATLVSKAMTIQGASGQEAAYGAIDLIHAISMGQLQSRQLRGLETEAPVLLRYIAQNLKNKDGGYGVAYGDLPQMAKDKQLNSSSVIEAVLRAQPQIDKDFSNAPKTATQAWQSLDDKIMQTVGGLAKVTGAQTGLFNWLQGLIDKADAFRQKMLLDPNSVRPFENGLKMIGDSVAGISGLGVAAAQHFDDIVRAGELILSLKLGEVMASWFRDTALAARGALGNVEAFTARVKEAAGREAAPAAAAEAGRLRAIATAQGAVADQKGAQAAQAAARAVDLKRMADVQAGQAELARGVATMETADREAIETAATRANASATSAATRASSLNTAAKELEARARAANVIAEEAEVAVTNEVTAADVTQAIAVEILQAGYGALGGALGIATIALGGLIFAMWQAEQARQKEIQDLLDAGDATAKLTGLIEEMTTASWNSVPALLAQADAALKAANAARDANRAEITNLQGQKADLQQQIAQGGHNRQDLATLTAQVQGIDDELKTRGFVDRATSDKAAREHVGYVTLQTEAMGREATNLTTQLNTGKTLDNQPLTTAQRSQYKARLASLLRSGVAGYQHSSQADQTDPQTAALTSAYHDVIVAAGGDGAAVNLEAGGHHRGGGRGDIDSAIKRAVDELEAQMVASPFIQGQIKGQDRYGVSGGKVVDTTTGGAFQARSEDEAKAAAKFQDAMALLAKANDKDLAKYGAGHTKAELEAAAEEQLRYALATSTAAKADEEWANFKAARLPFERQEAEVQAKINDLRAKGAVITEADAAAELMAGRARDTAEALKYAKGIADPVLQDQLKLNPAGKTKLTGHALDEFEEQDWQRRKIQIETDGEKQITDEVAKLAQQGNWDKQTQDQITTDAIAAYRMQVEKESADQIAKLTQQSEDQRTEAADKGAKEIEGAFHDLVFGGNVKDFGKKLVNDLLESVYENLIGNPMRAWISQEMQAILGGVAGPGNPGGVFSMIAQLLGFGGSGTAVGGEASIGSGISDGLSSLGLKDGGIPGYATGRRPGTGLFHGRGGPRSDSNLVRLSNREYIVNAAATRRNLPLLDAINGGHSLGIAAFAGGGLNDPFGTQGMQVGDWRDLGQGSNDNAGPTHQHIDNSIYAPGADRGQLAEVRKNQEEMARQFGRYAKNEPHRWANYRQADIKYGSRKTR